MATTTILGRTHVWNVKAKPFRSTHWGLRQLWKLTEAGYQSITKSGVGYVEAEPDLVYASTNFKNIEKSKKQQKKSKNRRSRKSREKSKARKLLHRASKSARVDLGSIVKILQSAANHATTTQSILMMMMEDKQRRDEDMVALRRSCARLRLQGWLVAQDLRKTAVRPGQLVTDIPAGRKVVSFYKDFIGDVALVCGKEVADYYLDAVGRQVVTGELSVAIPMVRRCFVLATESLLNSVRSSSV